MRIILDFLYNDIPGPNRLYRINMWSTPEVWKQYNKMAVLHFFPLNSSLYILFSMAISKGSLNNREYRCLLTGRVQFLYTIETALENIAYPRFHLIYLIPSYLWFKHFKKETYTMPTSERLFCWLTYPPPPMYYMCTA